MSSLIRLPIFTNLSEAMIKRYAVPGVTEGGCRVLTCDYHIPRSPPATKVFSTVLFVFPARMHSRGAGAGQYLARVEEYLHGFRVAVANVRSFPGWRYRLYVDRSVAMSKEQDAARNIVKAIDDLIRAFPQDLEVIGVRYLPGHAHPSFVDGETFLPSLWRYLPLVDTRVHTCYVVDSDNPPSPLGVGYAEGVARDAQLMITSPQSYFPPWCALYVATHLDEGDGVKVPAQHSMCPLGQAWCARRVAGSRLFSADTVNAMLALTGDRVAQQLFANLDKVGARKYLADVSARMKAVGVTSLEGAVDCAIDVAEQTPELRELKTRRRIAALFALAASSEEGAARLLHGHADVTKQLLVNLTREADEAMKIMGGIITRLDYGVDEFVLQVALCMVEHHGSNVRFLSPDTPDAGVVGINAELPDVRALTHTMLRNPVVGRTLKTLHRRARVQGSTAPMRARLMWVKLAFRTGTLLSWLRPLDGGDPAVWSLHSKLSHAYKERVRAMLHPPATDAELARVFSHRAMLEYRNACDGRIIKIDAARLQRWTAEQDPSRRVRYDSRRRGFNFDGSVTAFRAVADVFTRCLMLNIPFLYSRIPIEEPVRSWWI